jgi:hypothetical protein
VRNLQFYVSEDITLRREIESGGRQVTSGHKLLVVSGKTIEEVVIPEKTPGVATKVTATSIFVSFEPGTSLEFMVKGARLGGLSRVRAPSPEPRFERALLGQTFATPPNPFPGDSRPRATSPLFDEGEIGGDYWLAVDGAGNLFFASKAWEATDESASARLLIDTDSLEDVEEKRTVLPGVKLPSP